MHTYLYWVLTTYFLRTVCVNRLFFSPLFWFHWLHAISEKLSFGKILHWVLVLSIWVLPIWTEFNYILGLKIDESSLFSLSQISLVVQRYAFCFHFPKNWVLEKIWSEFWKNSSEFWLKTEFHSNWVLVQLVKKKACLPVATFFKQPPTRSLFFAHNN